MGGMVHVYGRDGNLTLFSLTAVSSLSQFFHYCVFFCYLSKWECKKYVTLEHKTLLGYICSNSQKYIVWVKIIYFSCQKSLGY